MATTADIARDKRVQNPRKIFSPSETSQPSPSNYLIYMSDTMSYSIVGRSSIKKIHGKKATLIFNKKMFTGEILFAGTFPRCQVELNKIQQTSQSYENNETVSINEEDQNDIDDYNKKQGDIFIETDDDNDEEDEELFNRFDESEDDLLGNESFGKKRKSTCSNSITKDCRQAKRKKQENLNENKSLKSIENKMNDLSKNMLKMNNAIRQIASSTRTGSHNLDCYRDPNNQEIFPSTVEYNGQNLLEIVGKDFGDYARQLMRVLYTNDELQSSILPPGRRHLVRKPLDFDRFVRLNESVRVKYRLASHMYDDFFKYHLGPKLSDFLVEERRREANKNARKQAKLALSLMVNEQSTN
ncbi:unnamed protein product [Rotaria sordida]|uniref:Uncharacterized protein n=1 Tax=Rotaria sordida TaxID=392033 RepID=A0A815C6W0_9BILA|nr:unnamed protein product [Rotaria sordida]